jgi:hypothetical protein
MSKKLITLAKREAAARVVDIDSIQIPDLWNLGLYLNDHPRFITNQVRKVGDVNLYGKKPGDAVIECWHLCHDLLAAIRDGDIKIVPDGLNIPERTCKGSEQTITFYNGNWRHKNGVVCYDPDTLSFTEIVKAAGNGSR